MTIEAITSVSAAEQSVATSSLFSKKEVNNDFGHFMTQYLNDTNQLIHKADINLRELAAGESGNIHEVLMSIEKAKTALELGLQVRNRLLEGYQEIMRMQI